jgi:WD40 repeat protein
MGDYLESAFRILVSAAGTTIAGPIGGVVGSMVGGLVGGVLPELASFFEKATVDLTSDSVGRLGEQVLAHAQPEETQEIGDSLQIAFRDALQKGLYDLGGKKCYPTIWKSQPDLPNSIVFPLTHTGKTVWRSKPELASQIASFFVEIAKAVGEGKVLPVEAPVNQIAADARTYLGSDKPAEINQFFWEQVFSPALSSYRTLFLEVPELESHLKVHLLDRTMIHLGNLLKERSEAWRSFNQIVLEEILTQVKSVGHEQNELSRRVESLVSSSTNGDLQRWSEQVADLLTLAGQMEKKDNENFLALAERLQQNHQEQLSRLETILAISSRIETKVDRMLRILEDGRWVVEGTPPISANEPPTPGEAPFKGLQFFDEHDEARFFGRELLTARLVNCLRQETFLAVVGASGSGKSSLVRAGLIPALEHGEPLADGTLPPAGSMYWPIHVITPTSHPLEMLAASLAGENAALKDLSSLQAKMEQDSLTLQRAARKLLVNNKRANRLLLVIDQFEEIFTLCRNETERQAFLENLLNASDLKTGGAVILVIALRADFYDHCGQYDRLRNAIASHQEYIGPMSSDELRRAIMEPAKREGWIIESGLVELILHDTVSEPGALPLLSHALLETWKHRRGRYFTLESYAESGGVRGAIARTAEAVYHGQLNTRQQQIARSIFLRLTELGEGTQDTRRRAALNELPGRPEMTSEVDLVLHALVDARLVTVAENSVEVAHEALIREWPTLRSWLDDSRDGLRIQRRLTESSQEWKRVNQDESLLYRGLRLAEAQEWANKNPGELNFVEREFLQTSQRVIDRENAEREAQQKREAEKSMQLAEVLRQRIEEQAITSNRLHKRAVFLTAALAIAAVFAITAIVFAQLSNQNAHSAQRNASAAEAASTQAVAQQRTAEAARQIALDQQATAQAENLRAEQASLRSRAAALAALSQSNLAKNPQRSILLGIEAMRAVDKSGSQRVPLAEEALWQAVSSIGGKPIYSGKSAFYSTAYSPDGRWLAAGDENGQTYLFDRKITENSPRFLTAHNSRVSGVVFSQDLRWLATGSWDKTIHLYSLSNLRAVPVILNTGHDGVNELAFSPNGEWLAAAMWDGTLLLWQVASFSNPPREINTSKEVLESVAFSPDNRQLAAAGRDGMMHIWSLEKPDAKPMDLEVSSKSVNSIAFSPNGLSLAAGGDDKVIYIFDLQNLSAKPLEKSNHKSWILTLAFSPDGHYLASGSSDQTIQVWNLQKDDIAPVILRGHESWVLSLVFSPDGRDLASGGWDGNLRIWNVSQPTTQPVTIGGMGMSLALSSSGSWLASCDVNNAIHLLDLNAFPPHEIFELHGHQNICGSLAFSPDEKWLASGSYDQTIRIWNLKDLNQAPKVLTGHTNAVYNVAFSPDSRYLVSSSWDKTARLWDMQKLSNPLISVPFDRQVTASVFSPDGRYLFMGNSNGVIKILEMSNLDAEAKEIFHTESGIFSMQFSPDGRLFAVGSADGRVWLWDPHEWESSQFKLKPQVWFGHSDAVSALAFSKDSRWLATGSQDQTILIWDLLTPSMEPVALSGSNNWIQGLAFTPDERWLISASWDEKIRFWTRQPEELEQEACKLTGRNLTKAEWEQYFSREIYRKTCENWPLESD